MDTTGIVHRILPRPEVVLLSLAGGVKGLDLFEDDLAELDGVFGWLGHGRGFLGLGFWGFLSVWVDVLKANCLAVHSALKTFFCLYQIFQGAWPLCQRVSRLILSRRVSMGCQKPL